MKPIETTTRDWIIEQSAILFNTKGYFACSLSDIMQATHLQKGGIYNYFRNKEEIALAAFDYAFQLVMRRFRSQLDQATSCWEKLNIIIDQLASMAFDPVIAGGCPIFNVSVEAPRLDPALMEKAKHGMQMLTRYIELKLEEGALHGEVTCQKPYREIASVIVGNLEGANIVARTLQDPDRLHWAVDHTREYLKLNCLRINF